MLLITAGRGACCMAFPRSQFIAPPYISFSPPCLAPAHIQETWLPAGSGSAQRRLQPVRKNSHLAPHASLHHPIPPCSLPGTHHSSFPLLPLLLLILPLLCLLLLLPFDSDHWVSLRLLCLRLHFAWQMDRRREDGLTSRGVCVCECGWVMEGEKERKRRERERETLKLFWEVKCQTAMKWGDFYLSNLCEVLPFRLLSDKAAVKRELRCESEGDRMSLPLIHSACHTVSALSVCALFYLGTHVPYQKESILVSTNKFQKNVIVQK